MIQDIAVGIIRQYFSEGENMANTKITQKNYAKERTSPAIIITVIAAAIILIGLIALAVISKTGVFNEKTIAMKVGDKEINAIEYSYYYTTVVNNWTTQYQTYLSALGYDSSKSPKAQTTKYGDQSWDQMFAEMTNTSLTQVKVLAAEAKKNGFQPDQDAIDEAVSTTRSYLEQSASYYGYSLNNFLKLMFNNTKGITIDKISEFVEESELAAQYGEKLKGEIEVSDSEIADYITENKADFAKLTYRFYDYKFDTAAEGSKDEAKAKADAHKAAGTTAELFEKFVHDTLNGDEDEKNDVKDETDLTLRSSYTASYISDENLRKWLIDDARQEGDTTVIEGETKYTVVYFIERAMDDYKLRDVRHILILGDKDSDSKVSDEEYEAAKTKAQELLDQYNNGKKTEETFAKLATDNTEDPGSKENGGLYEDVYKGYMVQEFEDWLFDETRKIGDTGLVKSDYGYHVMYFVGEGDRYCDYVAENTLKSDKYNSQIEDIEKGYNTEIFENEIEKITY